MRLSAVGLYRFFSIQWQDYPKVQRAETNEASPNVCYIIVIWKESMKEDCKICGLCNISALTENQLELGCLKSWDSEVVFQYISASSYVWFTSGVITFKHLGGVVLQRSLNPHPSADAASYSGLTNKKLPYHRTKHENPPSFNQVPEVCINCASS